MFLLEKLVREHIKSLTPQLFEQNNYTNNAKIFLDANENSLGSPLTKWYNRYPATQHKLKEAIAAVKGVLAENIFLSNGSDECIDLLYRCFCNPGKDNVIICPPTYKKFNLYAAINNVEIRQAPLLENFQLNLAHMESLADKQTKIIWLCSPNNPTGNSINREDIELVLNNFNALVVIDEAYIQFARQKSFTQELLGYPNLIILQTFSTAWGLAGLRLGTAFASAGIISIFSKIKPFNNISVVTGQFVINALKEVNQVNDMIRELVAMRHALVEILRQIPGIEEVYPSDANFILLKIKEARKLYQFLLTKGIVVCDKSNEEFCENCLRITVGTEQENTVLIDAFNDWLNI